MNEYKRYKKSILVAIGVFFIIPLITPLKVQAQLFPAEAGEQAQAAGGAAGGAAGSAGVCLVAGLLPTVGGFLNVPVSDSGNQNKECLLDSIATGLKDYFITAIKNDIINWANSGFMGQPAFLSNPQRFLGNIGDYAQSLAVESLGLGELCDFDIDIDLRALLSVRLGKTTPLPEIGCTFEGIADNIKNMTTKFRDDWQNTTIQDIIDIKSTEDLLFQAEITALIIREKSREAEEGVKKTVNDDAVPIYEDCDSFKNFIEGRPGEGVENFEEMKFWLKCDLEQTAKKVTEAVEKTFKIDLDKLGLSDEFTEIIAAVIQGIIVRLTSSIGGKGTRLRAITAVGTGGVTATATPSNPRETTHSMSVEKIKYMSIEELTQLDKFLESGDLTSFPLTPVLAAVIATDHSNVLKGFTLDQINVDGQTYACGMGVNGIKEGSPFILCDEGKTIVRNEKAFPTDFNLEYLFPNIAEEVKKRGGDIMVQDFENAVSQDRIHLKTISEKLEKNKIVELTMLEAMKAIGNQNKNLQGIIIEKMVNNSLPLYIPKDKTAEEIMTKDGSISCVKINNPSDENINLPLETFGFVQTNCTQQDIKTANNSFVPNPNTIKEAIKAFALYIEGFYAGPATFSYCPEGESSAGRGRGAVCTKVTDKKYYDGAINSLRHTYGKRVGFDENTLNLREPNVQGRGGYDPNTYQIKTKTIIDRYGNL